MKQTVTLHPFIKITDPHWIKFYLYTQAHPHFRAEITIRDSKPYEMIEMKESTRF